jgi:hypothetical protein
MCILGLKRLIGLTMVPLLCSSPTLAENADPPAIDPTAVSCPASIDVEKELMIRNLSVVEDPIRTHWTGSLTDPADGAWTFGRLMTNMAGSRDPEAFIRHWLALWATPQVVVNGFGVAARPSIQAVLDIWPKTVDGKGKLDLTRAPLRLLAIVNRMDLRSLADGNAGEGRFVFGVLGPAGTEIPFTISLDYELPATSQSDVDQWARLWYGLGDKQPAEYNAALQEITDKFAGRNARPSAPNGSALGQLRTNERAIGSPWELREFHIDAATGQLEEAPVAQTPEFTLNGTHTVADFINANETAILARTHVVPLTFEGAPFLGAAAPNPDMFNFWSASGVKSNEARHLFSLATCNGCHSGETESGLQHVNPRAAGRVAELSGFLRGTTVHDPVDFSTTRTFNDLARRANDLSGLLCSTVPAQLTPINTARVH